MVFPPRLRIKDPIRETLVYFDRFDYPLTAREIWYWQSINPMSFQKIQRKLGHSNSYFHLPGRNTLGQTRDKRYQYSQNKLLLLAGVVNKLKYIPMIKAVFVTGALAMNNSPKTDDIDIMIVTTSDTLWLTRPLVIAMLRIFKLRRDPHLIEHSSERVSDKICDNLWLDADHLSIPVHSLYQAHELLQAKCIYDCSDIHKNLIFKNPWVETYLPVAYRHRVRQLVNCNLNSKLNNHNIIHFPVTIFNSLLFILQYLYMRSHLTNERIGLGYAYFHPRKNT